MKGSEGQQKQNSRRTLQIWEESSTMEHYSREVFEFDSALLPELRILGWLSFTKALKGALQSDRHAGEIELHLIKQGHVTWWLESREFKHEIHAGELFLIKPGELHGGIEDSLQPCEHYWLRVKQPLQNEMLPGLPIQDTRVLMDYLLQVNERKAKATPEIEVLFEMLLCEHQLDRGPIARTCARSILHTLLIRVARLYVETRYSGTYYSWRIKRTISWLDDHIYENDLELDQLSSILHISTSGLRLRFKEETGFTPLEYVLKRRMKLACHYLETTEESITNIAHSIGISSSQYFATTFKRYLGITPSEYRNRNRARTE